MNNKPVFKRVFAFIIDILIVALITSIFANIEVLNPYQAEYTDTYNKLYDYILNGGKTSFYVTMGVKTEGGAITSEKGIVSGKVSVEKGENLTIYLCPEEEYEIDKILIDNNLVDLKTLVYEKNNPNASSSDGVALYTFENIDKDYSIEVFYKEKTNIGIPNTEKIIDEATVEDKKQEGVAIGNIDLNSPEMLDLQYDLTRYSLPTSIISLVVTVLYFVLFQYFNNGKTIGKALFKMRVTNKKGEKASIIQILVRTLFVDSILTSSILILFVCYMTKENFLLYNEYVSTIDTVIIMACLFLMLFRKDARGFHDLIAGTEVNYIDYKKTANVVEEKPVVVKEEPTKLEVAEPKKTPTTKKATTKKTTTTKKTATKKPVAKKTTTTKKTTTKKATVKKDK